MVLRILGLVVMVKKMSKLDRFLVSEGVYVACPELSVIAFNSIIWIIDPFA